MSIWDRFQGASEEYIITMFEEDLKHYENSIEEAYNRGARIDVMIDLVDTILADNGIYDRCDKEAVFAGNLCVKLDSDGDWHLDEALIAKMTENEVRESIVDGYEDILRYVEMNDYENEYYRVET